MRAKTFRAFAQFILSHRPRHIVETGTCRYPSDGQSTLILALLAQRVTANFMSIDINPDHIAGSKALLRSCGLEEFASWAEADSVQMLRACPNQIGALYLDSFDHDASNPGPCQRHELAELGAVFGALTPTCAVLVDDHIPETGGKTALGSKFLEDRGFKQVASGYQLLYVRGV